MKPTTPTAFTALAALLLAGLPAAAFGQDAEPAADDGAEVAADATDVAADTTPADEAESEPAGPFDAYLSAVSISMNEDGAYALNGDAVSGAALLNGRITINGAAAGDVADVILSEYGYGQFITYAGGRYVTFFESDVSTAGGVTVAATRAAGDTAPRVAPEGATNTLSAWLGKTVRFEDGGAGQPIVDVLFTPEGMMDVAIVDATAAGGPSRAAVPAATLVKTEDGGLLAVGRWADPQNIPAVDGV